MAHALTFGSVCSGIGGFELGLERAGLECIWQVENEPHCLKVLEKHWPEVTRYGDVREVDWSAVEPPHALCAGFPCQPVSTAGRGLAQDDPRGLWPEITRCLRDLRERPRWVVLENVSALAARGLGDVLGDLASLGYDCEWSSVSASRVGAPHLRDRIWIVGYLADADSIASQHEREPRVIPGTSKEVGGDPARERSILPQLDSVDRCGKAEPRIFTRRAYKLLDEIRRTRGDELWGEDPSANPGSGVRRVSHGVPNRAHRLRGLGNAVVPLIPEWIGGLIAVQDEGGR